MNSTIFIEKSYVIASIMQIKKEFLDEQFVTFAEANVIKRNLQNEFNNKSLNVCITDEIDPNYFSIQMVSFY